jgi:hypothetical protein
METGGSFLNVNRHFWCIHFFWVGSYNIWGGVYRFASIPPYRFTLNSWLSLSLNSSLSLYPQFVLAVLAPIPSCFRIDFSWWFCPQVFLIVFRSISHWRFTLNSFLSCMSCGDGIISSFTHETIALEMEFKDWVNYLQTLEVRER